MYNTKTIIMDHNTKQVWVQRLLTRVWVCVYSLDGFYSIGSGVGYYIVDHRALLIKLTYSYLAYFHNLIMVSWVS